MLRRICARLLVLSVVWLVPHGILDAAEPEATPAESERPTSDDESETRPTAAGTTSMTQAIQGESGIAIQTMCTNCNSADLTVGSFSNEFIEMTCDDVPVPPGLAQIYLLSVIPPTVIDNIEVEKGAGRAEAGGGAVGGTIELSRAPIEEGLKLDAVVDSGEFGWTGARADVSGKNGWFGFSLISSWAESDIVDADHDSNPEMAAIDRSTVEARAEFDLGRRQELRVGAANYDESQLGGRGNYDFIMSTPQQPLWNLENVDLERRQYDAVYDAAFRDGSTLMAGVSHSERSSDIKETLFRSLDSDPFFLGTYFIDEERLTADARFTRPLGNRVILRLGISGERTEYGIVDVRFNQDRGLPANTVQTEALREEGIWAEGEFFLGGGVNLFAGVRRADYEYVDSEYRDAWLAYALPQGNAWLPRLSMVWKPIAALNLRLSAGEGLRQPPPAYEEVCCGRRYRGNRGIRMEESRVYGLEATYQPIPEFKLKGSAFLSQFDDLLIKMAVQSSQYRPGYQNVNVPRARYESFAVEAEIDPVVWMTVKTSASWTDASNRTPGNEIPALIDVLGSGPTERIFVSERIPYVPERAGSVILQFRPSAGKLTIDASAQYTGTMLIQQFDAQTIDELGLDTVRFAEVPSFWITNLRLTGALPRGMQIFAGVDNLGDYVQPDLAWPSTDYTWGPLRGRYYYGGMSFHLGNGGMPHF